MEWKEIRLPEHEDYSQLALSYLTAHVLKWGHDTYHDSNDTDGTWKQFLQDLHSLEILSPENAQVLTTFIENKAEIDEVKRKKIREEVTSIVLKGVDKQHSLEVHLHRR